MIRILALLLCCSQAMAQDFVGPVEPIDYIIHLPVVPVLIEPDTPPPTNPNDPVRVSELGADQWYVVESSVPIIVISSPIGIVDIELSAGPIRFVADLQMETGRSRPEPTLSHIWRL